MKKAEKWIWLNSKKYPNNQETIYSALSDDKEHGNYTVAEFSKKYTFENEVTQIQLCVSGDTQFILYLNEKNIVTGPVNVGGDFLFYETPQSKHYSTELTLYPNSKELDFFAQVKMMPVAINEFSKGKGGFMLWAKLYFNNGDTKYISTDSSWLARCNYAYTAPYCFNQELDTDSFSPAKEVVNIWHTEISPLEILTENVIQPINNNTIEISPLKKRSVYVEFDKIYAGYLSLNIKTEGEISVTVETIETKTVNKTFNLKFNKSSKYRDFQLNSIGAYNIVIENKSNSKSYIEPFVTETHYPVHIDAKTYTNDRELNNVLNVCKHTLKSCRQMIHLDSPLHSEPLACTGDYYIESLMTSMSFGDMTLAEFDIIRTAEMLRNHNGRLFHTTYSLIWVMMLWDTYMINGNKDLLYECEDALTLLLDRFETYIGTNGLIETPPDFMFVDWIYIDEISMHHPPKALGQTSLCAFYYGALKKAEKLYSEIDEKYQAEKCKTKATSIKNAINDLLYDKEKGIFFDGLNTPTPKEMIYTYLPENVSKRYYMPHSNILCACFGVCDDDISRKIISKVVNKKEWGKCQPYFKHFLLEAIFRLNMRDEFTLSVLDEWKAPVKECSKGLVEGFITPDPAYGFDHSHAWGGTPLYSLPKSLLGLEILEPSYKKIKLSPTLLGLEYAHIEIPTKYGMMTFDLEQNKEIKMNIPKEITVILN